MPCAPTGWYRGGMATDLRPLATALALWLAAATAYAGRPTPWARLRTPSAGPAAAIGAYSAGCLAGGVALSASPELELLRPKHRRGFGHPELVDYVRSLAHAAVAQGLGRLRVGDLAQPRGGPAPRGHASHQTGLDVDLDYVLGGRRAGTGQALMVDRERGEPAKAFGEAQIELLRLAASDNRVARIFVNPVLKRALCARPVAPGEDAAWRARIRPWWGHDAHFHVRLRCPADSPDCKDQPALGPDDGCGAELDWWFAPHATADRAQAAAEYGKRVGASPALPPGCDALLPAKRSRWASPSGAIETPR